MPDGIFKISDEEKKIIENLLRILEIPLSVRIFSNIYRVRIKIFEDTIELKIVGPLDSIDIGIKVKKGRDVKEILEEISLEHKPIIISICNIEYNKIGEFTFCLLDKLEMLNDLQKIVNSEVRIFEVTYHLNEDILYGRAFLANGKTLEYSTKEYYGGKKDLREHLIDMYETFPEGIYTFSLPFVSLGEIKIGKVVVEKIPKKCIRFLAVNP